jgi:hypothetical protein
LGSPPSSHAKERWPMPRVERRGRQDYDAVQRCLDLVQLKFVECLVSHCSQRFGQFAEPESHSDDVIDYH